MHKFLNFFCFPLLITGFILLSSGILGYNSYDINVHTNTKTSAQINKLYSEKEILLKDPPVSETLSEKLVVKVRKKPINPEILTNIGQNKDINIISYLSDNDFDHLNNEKKEFVKTVLPIIINENQKIIMSRDFITNLKTKLEKFKTLNKKEITKLNKIADSYNIRYLNKHKLDLIDEILSNVDIIPNSIALAQAAIESGWGKSRFAKEYNALFGEYTYDQNEGVVPLKRELGDKHLIKSFSSFDNSVSSYFRNINSHYAYNEFRKVRYIMRSKNNFSDTNLLLNKLNSYAENDKYIEILESVIQKNKFSKFDSKIISY